MPIYVKRNGSYVAGTPFVKRGGFYVSATLSVKRGGVYVNATGGGAPDPINEQLVLNGKPMLLSSNPLILEI